MSKIVPTIVVGRQASVAVSRKEPPTPAGEPCSGRLRLVGPAGGRGLSCFGSDGNFVRSDTVSAPGENSLGDNLPGPGAAEEIMEVSEGESAVYLLVHMLPSGTFPDYFVALLGPIVTVPGDGDGSTVGDLTGAMPAPGDTYRTTVIQGRLRDYTIRSDRRARFDIASSSTDLTDFGRSGRSLGYWISWENDNTVSGDETLRFDIDVFGVLFVPGHPLSFSVAPAILRITDDDSPSTEARLSVVTGDGTVRSEFAESDGDPDGAIYYRHFLQARLNGAAFSEDRTLRLFLDRASSAMVGIADLADMNRMDGEDFTLSLGVSEVEQPQYIERQGDFAELLIPAGETTVTATFGLALFNDEVDEGEFEEIILGGEAGGLQIISVTLKIIDDDSRGVLVWPTSLQLTENRFKEYTVRLNSRPVAAEENNVVRVYPDISGVDAESIGFSREPLVFAPGNFAVSQTISVEARQDPDARDHAVSISHRVEHGGDYSGLAAPSVEVTVRDDNDHPSTGIDLALLPVDAEVAEGDAPVTLTLRAALNGVTVKRKEAVVVTLSGTDADRAIASLAADYDYELFALDGGDPGERIVGSRNRRSFTLAIEAGETEAALAIQLTPIDDLSDERSGFSDGGGRGDEFFKLEYALQAGTSLQSLNPASSTVRIIDNDRAGFAVMPSAIVLCEGATSAESSAESDSCQNTGAFEVSLATRPQRDEQVTVVIAPVVDGSVFQWGGAGSGDRGQIPYHLRFNHGGPLMQSVTVEALNNDIANEDSTHAFRFEISSTAEAGGYNSVENLINEVTVEDRFDESGLNFVAVDMDGSLGAVIEGDSALVSESETGGEYLYGVVPTSQPPAGQPVVVTVSISSDDGDAAMGLQPQELMFTSSDWRITQTVRVTLNHNMAVTGARIVSINHMAAGGEASGVSQSYDDVRRTLQLTVTDNESPPTAVNLTASLGSFPEGDEDRERTVNLTAVLTGGGIAAFQQAKDLTLFFDQAGSDAMMEGDFTASIEVAGQEEPLLQEGTVLPMQIPSGVLQGEPIILRLTVLGDDVDEDDETIVIRAEVEGLEGAVLRGGVALVIEDDDTSDVVFTGAAGGALPKPLIVRERGEVTYRVALTSEPTAEVRVMPDNRSDIAFEPTELQFTPENWDQAQPISLRGLDNPADAEIRKLTIGHTLSSADSRYAAVPSPSFPLELIDPSIVLEPGDGLALSLADNGVQGVWQAQVEEGEAAAYLVRLTSTPALFVGVEVSILTHREAIVGAIDRGLLGEHAVFTNGRILPWNRPQTVILDTADNDYYSGDRVVIVEHLSSDDDIKAATLVLTVTDDEEPPSELALSLSRMEVEEAAGTVELIVSATLDVARDEEMVVQLLLNEALLFSSLGLSGAELADEGTDFEFDVPEGMRTLTISAREREGELTFRLTLIDDDYDEDVSEFLLISAHFDKDHPVPGLTIDPAAVAVTILDDDVRGVRIEDGTGVPLNQLTVVEAADHVGYWIVLTSAPVDGLEAVVTIGVDYGGPDSSDRISLNGGAGNAPLTLTFGDTNSDNPWNVPQTVSVSLAVNEVVSGGRGATLTHSATGADYGAVSVADLELMLTNAGVTIDPPELALIENHSVNSRSIYVVSLVSQPSAEVQLRVTAPEGTAVNSEETIILTFAVDVVEDDDSHWSRVRNVEVNVMNDELSNGMRLLRIEHSVSSDDPNYDSLSVDDVVLTITDDETLPDIRLTLNQSAAIEGSAAPDATGGTGLLRTIEVTATAELVDGAPRSQPTTVTLSFGAGAGDTAAAPADYRIAGPLEIEIPAGQRSAVASFELTLVQDRIDEGNAETFTVTVTHMETEALPVFGSEIVFTINDDDTAGVIHTLQPRNVREGDDIRYMVVLTSQPEADVVVEANVFQVPGSNAQGHVEGLPVRLGFTPQDWHQEKRVTFTVADEVPDDGFGEFSIGHDLRASADERYQTLTVDPILLELTDVDLSLQTLELRLGSASADALALMPVFNANVLEYSADIPFDAVTAFIRAVATVTEDIRVGGDLVQNAAEVRILFGDAELSSDDEAELPATESDFEFLIEVSAAPVEEEDETALQTYTLTLRRALPADAALLVFPAADAERQRPLTMDTPLNFGPDVDEMDLIFVVRDEDGNSYSISELEAAGPGLGARVLVETGSQMEPEDGVFETPVTLRRDLALTAGTFTFSLTFMATPPRPLAVGAGDLTADIAGTLYDNSETETEIRASYRGHDQEQALPVTPGEPIRVSSNGTVTIVLRVERLSGGLRDFEQASFTLSVTPDNPRVVRTGNRLEIAAGDSIDDVAVSAAGGATLGGRINNPAVLQFGVNFVRPTAEIRPAASADALFDFDSNLFFAFVNEDNDEDNGEDNDNDDDNRLPLEVALTETSTPLANSGDILRGISLTLTVTGQGASNAIRIGGSAGSAAPGRDLLFEVMAPRANVGVTVEMAADASAELTALVDVASLEFAAHLLSFIYDDEIEIDRPGVISRVILKGAGSAESWTLSVGNPLELADGGYEVEEVIVVERATRVSRIFVREVIIEEGSTTSITTYSSRTVTVTFMDGDGPDTTVETDPEELAAEAVPAAALALFAADESLRTATVVTVNPATYRPATPEELVAQGIVSRTLQITSQEEEPRNNRILLDVGYRPGVVAEGAAGRFSRIIALLTGREAELNAEVRGDDGEAAETIVLPRGGSTELTLVISNLIETDDPNVRGAITYRFDQADLRVALAGEGELDRTNRRFTQRLAVEVSESADRAGYPVSIDVRLGGRSARAEFSIDINDAPEYVGETTLLTVKESGDAAAGGVQIYVLIVRDPDGGLMELRPDDLMLEAVLGDAVSDPFTFGTEAREQGLSLPYFSLQAGSVEQRKLKEGGGANELFVTLTITGQLATPFGSVVELRLSGASDGYDELDQRLLVQVEDVTPTFSLATTTVTLFADQREVVLELDEFSDGRRGTTPEDQLPVVVVQHAPDDLVVRFDREQRQVTLIRLNDSQDDEDEQITLVVVDSQGGRTEVILDIGRPPLLPQILPPSPLLVVAGDDNPVVRELSFTEATDLEMIWTASGHEELNAVVETLEDGSGRVTVSASLAVVGRAFMLELTATSADGMVRTVDLPVVVVSPAPQAAPAVESEGRGPRRSDDRRVDGLQLPADRHPLRRGDPGRPGAAAAC